MEYDDIVDCKASCDGKQYFDLFDKHIPELKAGTAVLLYAISNIDCIANIISKNPRSIYYICDTETIFDLLKLTNENTNLVYVESLNNIIEKDMKFDCIIMNPPYSRNLHLKILAEAIKHLKDDESVCVNLSPVSWLKDPLAKYKKTSDFKRFEDKIISHTVSLETFTKEYTNLLFGIDTLVLGIYTCISNKNKNKIIEFTKKYSNWVVDKVYSSIKTNKLKTISDACVYDDMSGICCVTSMIVFGYRDKSIRMKYGWLTQSTDKLFYTNCKNDASGQTYLEYRTKVSWGKIKPKAENLNIKFDSIEERNNFYSSWRTNFLRYFYDATVTDFHVHPEFMPWLGDCINPHTGLIGYKSEWTDVDLYQFFNITPEEQKVIEETMAKYK